jgi:DNA helicase-2/ATP-dependent DNA helicase PcrA
MAAEQLGFPNLYAAFNDGAPASLKNGFSEMSAWPLAPFLEFLLPVSVALEEGRHFDVIDLLRRRCPRLNEENLRKTPAIGTLLAKVKSTIVELSSAFASESNKSVKDVLQLAMREQLVKLDDRLCWYMNDGPIGGEHTPVGLNAPESRDDGEERVVQAFLNCPAKQVRGYRTYMNGESPYSTQQGIKGAEFERVLVVLDDDNGRHPSFSYDTFLGLKLPSKTDNENKSRNKETVTDRTRRLFYVCCSRAKKDLAVVLYTTSDVQTVASVFRTKQQIFDPSDIHTLDDVTPATCAGGGTG